MPDMDRVTVTIGGTTVYDDVPEMYQTAKTKAGTFELRVGAAPVAQPKQSGGAALGQMFNQLASSRKENTQQMVEQRKEALNGES